MCCAWIRSKPPPLTVTATHRVQAALKDEALKDEDWAALSHAIEALIVGAQDGTAAFKQTMASLVLEEAKMSSLRGRTWFKLMNFDADPGKLSDIPTMLNAEEATQDPKRHGDSP